MSIEVKYLQSSTSCDSCDKKGSGQDNFFIIHIVPSPPYHLDVFLCPSCFKELQSKMSPLSVLVATGINTKS